VKKSEDSKKKAEEDISQELQLALEENESLRNQVVFFNKILIKLIE
jgi:hypothetical protein